MKYLALMFGLLSSSSALGACPGLITSINPQIGETKHVTVIDQNCKPVPPSGLKALASPNASGFVEISIDAVGINFKGLAGGQFVYTITDPVGAEPFPSTTLTVTVGPIPTSIAVITP